MYHTAGYFPMFLMFTMYTRIEKSRKTKVHQFYLRYFFIWCPNEHLKTFLYRKLHNLVSAKITRYTVYSVFICIMLKWPWTVRDIWVYFSKIWINQNKINYTNSSTLKEIPFSYFQGIKFGKNRRYCDIVFYRRMLSICRRQRSYFLKRVCRKFARIYYIAVRLLGKQRYSQQPKHWCNQSWTRSCI